MAKAEVSESADEEIDSDSNSDSVSLKQVETPIKKISSYEKQRIRRIEENRARMEALGLKKMASTFASYLPKQAKKTSSRNGKGKGKMEDDDDEEYRPSEGEEVLGSSSVPEESDGVGDDDDEFSLARTRKKGKGKTRTQKKASSSKMPVSDLDFAAADDEALAQAIALSLQDSTQFRDANDGASQSSSHPVGRVQNAREGNSPIQEDVGKRKRKKSMNSRVQMTEDELIIHFFQLDETGKGNINLRDLQKVAAVHDFTWSEKEMADMILCFDSDGDGKLSPEDFRKIAGRCNMIQGLETD